MDKEQPEQPTPDSLNLLVEMDDFFSSTACQEYYAAQAERDRLLKRGEEIGKRIGEILNTMTDRAGLRLDITPQARALRFEFREAALVAKQAIHIDACLSRAMSTLSEKLSVIIKEV